MAEEISNDDGGEETVILARMTDAVQAGALRELLENEGISVSTPGMEHRSLLGIAGGYVEILVRVPKKDLARAQELQESIRSSTPVDPPESGAPEEKARTDRLRRIALFAAIWLPFGGGHFYARRWGTGFFFLALQLATVACAFVWPLFWYAIPWVAIADAVGAVRMIGADQRGEAPDILARMAPVLALVVVLLVPGARGLAPHLLAGDAMVRACRRASECAGGEEVDRCIAAAADRTFAGSGTRARDRDCAECLEESLCEDIPFECSECDGLVHLPAATRPAEPIPGLFGAGADDLVHVVPTLFPADHPSGPPSPEMDDLLRLLDEAPPPTTPPSSPARP